MEPLDYYFRMSNIVHNKKDNFWIEAFQLELIDKTPDLFYTLDLQLRNYRSYWS